MNALTEHPDLCREFASLLELARRRLHAARMLAGVRTAVERGAVATAAAAAALCVSALACRAAGAAAPFGWPARIAILVVAWIAPAGITMVLAWRRRPTLGETAERLDFRTRVHNRTAIALSLEESGQRSPFARAAIEDGLATLRRIRDELPHTDAPPHSWRRTLMSLTVAAALIGLMIASGAGRQRGTGASAPVVAAVAPQDRRPARIVPDAKREAPPAAVAQSRPTAVAATRASRQPATTQPTSRASNQGMAQRAAGQATADAASSALVTSASGASADAAQSAGPSEKKPPKPPGGKRQRETNLPAVPKAERAEESSSVAQGSSGGGAMSAVSHNWSQREQTAEPSRDEDDADQPTEDERESNVQRGGVQPSLKDRNEAPTRELGISGEEGPPGTGRGGPTPPKKSRGTASLVLGVPVPDFVKGRIGPGVTKVTHERIEPTPMPGETAVAAEVARRTSPEAPSRRYDIPSAFADIVRRYLVTLHSADQGEAAGRGRPSSPDSGTRKE